MNIQSMKADAFVPAWLARFWAGPRRARQRPAQSHLLSDQLLKDIGVSRLKIEMTAFGASHPPRLERPCDPH